MIKTFGLLIILIFLLAGISFIFTKFSYTYAEDSQIKHPTFSNQEDQLIYHKWASIIKQSGGKNAYQLFLHETNQKPIPIRHRWAHLFGEALYHLEGTSAITICDDSFDSGCYHSFLGIAIATEGLPIVATVSEACSKNPDTNIGCQHGLGHGIVADLGYDLPSLQKAVQLCKDVRIFDPKQGCLYGIFMEYNFQTVLLDQGQIRTYNPVEPFNPCTEVITPAKEICYLQQAQWWVESMNLPLDQTTKQIDTLCAQLETPYRNSCYKGFGIKLIAYLGYDINQAKDNCKKLKEENSRQLCYLGILTNIQNIPSLTERKNEVCKEAELVKLNVNICQES